MSWPRRIVVGLGAAAALGAFISASSLWVLDRAASGLAAGQATSGLAASGLTVSGLAAGLASSGIALPAEDAAEPAPPPAPRRRGSGRGVLIDADGRRHELVARRRSSRSLSLPSLSVAEPGLPLRGRLRRAYAWLFGVAAAAAAAVVLARRAWR